MPRPAALVAALLLVGVHARAQPVPSLDLRNFHPPADARGSLYLEPSSTPGPGAWSAGAMVSYANRLVTLEDDSGESVATPVEHQLSLDYLATLGIMDRLAVNLTLPTVLYQTGDDSDALLGDGSLPQTAIGDVAFGAKATLIPTAGLGGFGLAALGRVTAPTGDARSYVSDSAVTGELRLLGELKLIAVAVQATAGARVRGEERTYVGEEFGHDLPWGAGIVVRPQAFGLDHEGRWLWVAEARGQVAITPEFGSGPQSPALAGLSARYTVGDVSFLAGAELPLNDAVGSPRVRGVLGINWSPRFEDMDNDGVPDEQDECAELPEDRDGFEDSDGCPDFDNDDDGVPDEEDRCPKEQEDEDEFEDGDGCIDPDNDKDGILDDDDECPDEAAPGTANGCPNTDADKDGVLDGVDQCKTEPEDKDGFQDEDGCPDPDNDGDGVPDEEDACPALKGQARSDAKLNGCPNPDTDGDTLDDDQDKCQAEPEDFDGVEDEDGCKDDDSDKPAWQRAKPLMTVEKRGDDQVIKWRVPPRLETQNDSVDIADKTLPSVRALAQKLNQHPSWVALVGVQPKGNTSEAQQKALSQSFAIVHRLRGLTHRDEVAESVGWAAVKDQPDAYKLGYGIVLLTHQKGRLALPPRQAPKPGSVKPAPPPAPPPAPAPQTAPTSPPPPPAP